MGAPVAFGYDAAMNVIAARWGIAAFLLLAPCALPSAAQQAGSDAAVPESAGEVEQPYRVRLVGASGDLEDLIKRASQLITLEDRPPGSLVALQRRVDGDREIVREALRAEGYYAGKAEIAVDATVRPVAVTITVERGRRFVISELSIRPSDPGRGPLPIGVPLEELGLVVGDPLRAEDVIEAQQNLIMAFARRAYPLAEVVDRNVVVDHATFGASIAFVVDSGPPAAFGEAEIRGLEDVEAQFVRNRLPWRAGEPFDLTRLEEARKRLVETNLFSSIRLTPADELAADGRLPVVVEVEERKARTIGGAINYDTDQGFGIEGYWEHRNLLGAGERLRSRLFFNELGFGGEGAFRNPDLFGIDRDLVANVGATRLDTRAFNSTATTGSLGAELRLGDYWTVTAAGTVEYLIDKDDGVERDFLLAGLPLVVKRDSSDDLLDPTEGGRLILQLTPYYDVTGSTDPFVRVEFSDTAYLLVLEDPRVVAAGWIDIGSTVGSSLGELPPSKRFYAGGGGSVRAFGLQMAGPLEDDGDPEGGLSMLAIGGELRIKVTDTIGVVPFIEAGTVYPERYPDFSETLRWGAGLGVRYFTPVGPIRADIAVPINARSEDDAFQVYISFGQAF